ncbi:hypothetical protein [Burkholderia phage FLC9]|nr:hypothetical protein [Burkholderia phage FLC9]
MAGFLSKVPPNGTLVPVTLAQFEADLIAYSDQLAMPGWQARDSYFKFVEFTLDQYARRGITLTQDQLILYYYADPTLQMSVIASNVALDVTALKQPRYARMSYKLDPTSGMIVDFGVHQFTRWTFYYVPLKNPAPDFNLTTE